MSSSDSSDSVHPKRSSRTKSRKKANDMEETNDMEEADTEGADDEMDTRKTSSRGTDTQMDSQEARDEEIVSTLSRRFLQWTSEDLFDFNPGYAASVRGILNIVQIILGLLIMTLVGSACQYPLSTKVTFFYCHSSAAFTFVITCSASIQSILFFTCCMLSKKANTIIVSSPMEMLYYIVYAFFYCIAGLVVEGNLSYSKDGYDIIMAAGVFAITNSVLYFMSAIWFCIFHKTRRKAYLKRRGRRNSSASDIEQ